MKKKTLSTEEKLFLSKITGYSALAGAALLLTPIVAKGEIIYVDPEDKIINLGDTFVAIDIDSDGNNDFGFMLQRSQSFSYQYSTLSVGYIGSSNAISGSNSYVAKQSSDISVASGNNWMWSGKFVKGYYYTSSITPNWQSENGNWKDDADNKYFGVKFEISGSMHYGWIRASVEDPAGGLKLTIHDWAYEDVAGESIKTGETPLPIELANFIITEENGSVRLNWQTASETENSGFIIQRKTGAGSWEKIVDHISDPTLQGQGTTSETNSYSWLDENVEPGTTYQYRLGDIDHANTIVWHDVLVITVSEEAANMPGEFGLKSAFPNPFNPTLTIRYGLTEDAQTSVKILDLQGKTISTLSNKHQKAGSYELQWQAEGVASGMYLVEIVSGEKKDLKKVLLEK